MTAARIALVEGARAHRQNLAAERERKIDEMCKAAQKSGDIVDRIYWSMVYDFEMAPSTNSRSTLMELGVIPVPPQELKGAQELHEALWTVIEALASRGIYFLNTDHLTDSQLYERLFYKILDEPTQVLPPAGNASEFIDVLHPWDIDAGGLGAELSKMVESGSHPSGEPVSGHRAPIQLVAPVDRDRFLPGPLEPAESGEGEDGEEGGGDVEE